MNTLELFSCLDDYEKELILELSIKWKENKEKEEECLLERNTDTLMRWSDNKITDRLKKAVSKHYTLRGVTLTLEELNHLEKWELKKVRNIGDKSIDEFFTYKA